MMARHWRKHDPLTFRYARYPHESDTPADYAKSIEGHTPDLEGPYWVVVAIATFAIFVVIGLLIFEGK
jgi:hypothetical protein